MPPKQEHFHGTLELKKMTGDGNCLFHALGEKERDDAVSLREEIIDFLEETAKDQEKEQEEVWLEEAAYLRNDPSAWGGDTAIVAFTLMRHQRVMLHWRGDDGRIHTDERTHLKVAEELQAESQDITHLWYNGTDHYDLLLPSQTDGPPSPTADPADAKLEDVLEEVSRAAVAAASDHPHRALEDAIKSLADGRIRDEPTIPPLASRRDVDAGEAWPHAFCAFSGCIWSSRTGGEEDLELHLADQHASDLLPLATLLPGKDSNKFLSVYNAAISVKCRAQAPIAGSSLDRSALAKFAAATARDNVESLVCFSCACTYTRLAETENKGEIRWHRPAMPADGTFLGQPLEIMKNLLGVDQFLAKYDELEGGAKMSDSEDLGGWQVSVTDGRGSTFMLLGCPEDHRCTANPEHPRQGTLCEHCELPICQSCHDHLCKKKLPPLSLANDMWSGYGPETLYSQNVTVMEMLCASPCITTLVCLSMEARHHGEEVPGKSMDETAHMARHRQGARGNALTFPMPWEDLLQKLQHQNGPEAAALPRSPQELSGIVRVILTTNKEGQTTQADIKNLVHQANVRREVVVKLILDMKRYGHPSFQGIDEQQVLEKAASLPEDGVPAEVVKIIHQLDGSQEKLQPQKAATPTDGMQTLDQAGQGRAGFTLS